MFGLFKKKLTVVTHNGSFHADDVFACATLILWAEKENINLKIVRSRDEEVIQKADIVVDVGMEYDPERKRFDHHQRGGAGNHDNAIPYASFGLVWKEYGAEICGGKEIAKMIEVRLVMPIDARDNGISISIPNEHGILDHRTSGMISSFNTTWLENYEDTDKQFKKILNFVKEIVKREIASTKSEFNGVRFISEENQKQNSPAILILDKHVDWEQAVSKLQNVKLV